MKMAAPTPTSIWLSLAAVCLLVGVYFLSKQQPEAVQPKVPLEAKLPEPEVQIQPKMSLEADLPEPEVQTVPKVESVMVEKSEASTSLAAKATQTKPLVVSIDADGRIFLGEELLPEWQLFDAFFQLALQNGSETVFFRAAETVTYQKVMQVMEEASRAGFTNLALVTDSGGSPTSLEPQPLGSGEVLNLDDEAEAIAAALAEAAKNSADDLNRGMPEGPPMTEEEKQKVSAAINSCWNIGILSSAAQRVKLVMRFEVNEDGKPVAPSIQMTSFEGDDAAAQQAFEAAKRAVVRGARGCGGYDGYQSMFAKGNAPKTLEIYFDASGTEILE